MDKNHLIINSKMEKILNSMPADSVDCIITDPPFGIRTEQWDDRINFMKNVSYWLDECLRVTKHAVIWFGADKMLPYVLRSLILEDEIDLFCRQHVWIKPEGSQFAGASYNNIWYSDEFIWVFSKDWDKTKSYGKDMPYGYNSFSYRPIPFNVYKHPTSKPVPLMRKLIGYYSSPGELILDPFAGSGSTAIACIDMGRRSLLIEENKEYYNIAKNRIQKHLNEPRMFIGVNDNINTEENITIDIFKQEN